LLERDTSWACQPKTRLHGQGVNVRCVKRERTLAQGRVQFDYARGNLRPIVDPNAGRDLFVGCRVKVVQFVRDIYGHQRVSGINHLGHAAPLEDLFELSVCVPIEDCLDLRPCIELLNRCDQVLRTDISDGAVGCLPNLRLEKVNLLIIVVDIDAVDALVERVVAHRVARLDFVEPIDVLQEPNQE
jgi:hypothetical protein